MSVNDTSLTEMLFTKDKDAAAVLVDEYSQRIYNVALSITDSVSDSEEIVNDVCLAVINAIPPARPENLLAYILGITRKVSFQRVRYTSSQKRDKKKTVSITDAERTLPAVRDTYSEYENRKLREELNIWIGSLSDTDRYIFIRRYWYMDKAKTIAKKLNFTESRVSRRLRHIKSNLKKYLAERGFDIDER